MCACFMSFSSRMMAIFRTDNKQSGQIICVIIETVEFGSIYIISHKQTATKLIITISRSITIILAFIYLIKRSNINMVRIFTSPLIVPFMYLSNTSALSGGFRLSAQFLNRCKYNRGQYTDNHSSYALSFAAFASCANVILPKQ